MAFRFGGILTEHLELEARLVLIVGQLTGQSADEIVAAALAHEPEPNARGAG